MERVYLTMMLPKLLLLPHVKAEQGKGTADHTKSAINFDIIAKLSKKLHQNYISKGMFRKYKLYFSHTHTNIPSEGVDRDTGGESGHLLQIILRPRETF